MKRSIYRAVSIQLALLVFVSTGSIGLAQNENQLQSEARLKQLLARFPDADINGDGILTQAELQAYRQKMRQQQLQDLSSQRNADRSKPTHQNVAYGDHRRQVLDLYLAKSDKPTPLIVYIHGGGFVAGTKSSVNPAMIAAAHKNGISVAALHYRFVNGKDIVFPAPQHDCARALQYLRASAKKYNLKQEKVCLLWRFSRCWYQYVAWLSR